MSSLKTQLSVQQIQLGLRNSDLFNQRSDIIVPNLSWSILPYEADLIGISRSGQVTEVEIKRSLADLRADYKKDHRHDASCVTYFFYCVPEKLVEKAKTVILECEQKRCVVPITEKDCPALLYYNEKGQIFHTGFGKAKRFGFHQSSSEDRESAGRMASLRYWGLLEKTICPEDRGLQKKIRDLQTENRAQKIIIQNIEEDYNVLKRMLRYKYPEIWQEFLNMDSPAVEHLKEMNLQRPPKKRIQNKNPKTQFELHTFDYDKSVIREAYEWCLANLPLKDERGIMYRVDQLYIITASQKILDKMNAHFGSNFSFNHPIGDLRFFISKKLKENEKI